MWVERGEEVGRKRGGDGGGWWRLGQKTNHRHHLLMIHWQTALPNAAWVPMIRISSQNLTYLQCNQLVLNPATQSPCKGYCGSDARELQALQLAASAEPACVCVTTESGPYGDFDPMLLADHLKWVVSSLCVRTRAEQIICCMAVALKNASADND